MNKNVKDNTQIIDKLHDEANELFSKMIKLEDFINGNKFSDISAAHKYLLAIQFDSMRTYHDVLLARIEDLMKGE